MYKKSRLRKIRAVACVTAAALLLGACAAPAAQSSADAAAEAAEGAATEAAGAAEATVVLTVVSGGVIPHMSQNRIRVVARAARLVTARGLTRAASVPFIRPAPTAQLRGATAYGLICQLSSNTDRSALMVRSQP